MVRGLNKRTMGWKLGFLERELKTWVDGKMRRLLDGKRWVPTTL